LPAPFLQTVLPELFHFTLKEISVLLQFFSNKYFDTILKNTFCPQDDDEGRRKEKHQNKTSAETEKDNEKVYWKISNFAVIT